MGVVTWDGSASTDYGTAANWDSGVVPSGSSNVVIPDTSSINNCILDTARTVNSFRIDANGTFDGDGNLLTVDSEGDASTGASEGYAVNIDGIIAGTDTDIAITTPATTLIDLAATSGSIRHLTINHASCVATMYSDVSLSGDLTITAGQLTTGDGGYGYSNLTVAGNTVVDGTLTGNNSTFSFGTNGVSGSTEGGCLLVNSSGTFTFGSGDVTIFSGFTAKGTEGSPNVTSTGGGDIIIKGRTNNGFMNSHNHNGTNITGDYIIDYDNNSIFDNRGGVTIACGTFKIIHGGRTYEPWNNAAQATFKIVGNMEISGGTFDTEYSGQSSQHLTVTGHVSVTGTLTGNASAISVGSMIVNASGTYTATSGTTTITSETSSHAFRVSGSGTLANSNGTILITTPAETRIKMNGTGNVHNLTVNHASCVVFTHTDSAGITVEGNLTITAGTLNTSEQGGSDKNLTVTGLCTVNGTLTGNASAISIGGLLVGSSGKYNATSGTTTVTAEDSTGYAWDVNGTDSFDNNDGGVTFDLGSGVDSHIRTGQSDGANSFHNLTVLLNASSNTLALRPNAGSAMTIEGNLTISEGKFYKYNDNYSLTVNGNVEVHSGGELGLSSTSGNDTFGSLSIDAGGTCVATSGTTTITNKNSSNYIIQIGGLFTHNGGTVYIDTSVTGDKLLDLIPSSGVGLNHLKINEDGSGVVQYNGNTTIAGNLTIEEGIFQFYDNNNSNLTVTGDVDIESGGQLGAAGWAGAGEFGGIRINSGGTYQATSGTTTVTNRFTGTSNLWKNDGGTFTHNNGTVKFTDNDHSLVKELTFYNLEQASSLGDYALSWETQSGTACTILGNLTITRGDFEIHAAGNTLDIHGQTILNGSSDTGARFNNDKNQTGTITHHGIVTINGGTYHVEDGATVNMAGIRNLGGVVD